ncbi:hypothetical protein GCM10009676_31630 [Prauserella halophila]|uniref:Uncharacterized protein n=1 Tax=Prauserella halophila TaxID=185641 RepID=A0ABP4H3C1_9PSEU
MRGAVVGHSGDRLPLALVPPQHRRGLNANRPTSISRHAPNRAVGRGFSAPHGRTTKTVARQHALESVADERTQDTRA